MDDRISFDVYAMLKNPHFRVDFQEDVDRVELVFGGPSFCEEPLNMLSLWFTDPRTVLDLARELCLAGTQFVLAQKEAARHTADSESGNEPEEYPVPGAKFESGKGEGNV